MNLKDPITLAAVALAGVAVFVTLKPRTSAAATQPAGQGIWAMLKDQRNQVGAATQQNKDWVAEVFDSGGIANQNGWRYYDNGTAISPAGDYYYQGQLVRAAGA